MLTVILKGEHRQQMPPAIDQEIVDCQANDRQKSWPAFHNTT
jgi:hypothetical protein